MATTATGGRKRQVWGVRAMGTMGVIGEDVAALPWRKENRNVGLESRKSFRVCREERHMKSSPL